MELVEGPTLAERIAPGAIPLEEGLPIARQICDGLEYAHERGNHSSRLETGKRENHARRRGQKAASRTACGGELV
jgi:serine/threonine protein kinase